MSEAYIFDAIRTPRGRGKANGSLHEVKPITLVSDLLNTLVERNNFDTSAVDDIVLGCVSAVGDQGAVISRVAALNAGWQTDSPGMVLNRFCASGLEAVNTGAMKLRSGFENLVVTGGVESMSRVPMGSDGGAWAMDPATNFKTGFMPQGIGADLIATLQGYSREQLDEFAAGSHNKAAAAWQRQAFAKSIIPVVDQNGLPILDRDETIRPGSTAEGLGKLNLAFQGIGEMGFDGVARKQYPQVEAIAHMHTAANSSGIVDGACTLLMGSEAAAKQHGLKPRAKIVATAVVGSEPTIMLTGPAPAARKALKVAGLSVNDIDLFEVNEAFASVVLKFIDDMQVDPSKVNVNGGAIAMGHPLGATGAMLVNTLIDELEAQNLKRGLVTLCVGAGMGIATIVERV